MTHLGHVRALELPRGNENLTWGFPNAQQEYRAISEITPRQFMHVVGDELYGLPTDSQLSTGYYAPGQGPRGFGPGTVGDQVAVDPPHPGAPLAVVPDSEVDSASIDSDSEIEEVVYHPAPSAGEMIGALRRLAQNRYAYWAYLRRLEVACLAGVTSMPGFSFTRQRQRVRRPSDDPPSADPRDARDGGR